MKDKEHRQANIPAQKEDDTNTKPEAQRNSPDGSADSSRRSFLGKMGGATAVALAVGLPLEPLFEGKRGQAEASVVNYGSSGRAHDSFEYREDTAQNDNIDIGKLPDNGDDSRYTDFSGLWSKCLKHDGLGVPNAASYQSFLHALDHREFLGLRKHHRGQSRVGRDSPRP